MAESPLDFDLNIKFLVDEIIDTEENFVTSAGVHAPPDGVVVGRRRFPGGQLLPQRGTQLPREEIESLVRGVANTNQAFNRTAGQTATAISREILRSGGSTPQAVAAIQAGRAGQRGQRFGDIASLGAQGLPNLPEILPKPSIQRKTLEDQVLAFGGDFAGAAFGPGGKRFIQGLSGAAAGGGPGAAAGVAAAAGAGSLGGTFGRVGIAGAAGSLIGAGTGATAGAAIGSLVPGIGTVVGALIGVGVEKAIDFTVGGFKKLTDVLNENVEHFRAMNRELAPFSGLLLGQQVVQDVQRDVLRLGRAHDLAPELFRREQAAFGAEVAGFNLQTEFEKLRLDITGPLLDIFNFLKQTLFEFLTEIVKDLRGLHRLVMLSLGGIREWLDENAGALGVILGPGTFPLIMNSLEAIAELAELEADKHRFGQVLEDLDFLLFGGPNPVVPRKNRRLNFNPLDHPGGPGQFNVGQQVHDTFIEQFQGIMGGGAAAAGLGGFPVGFGEEGP